VVWESSMVFFFFFFPLSPSHTVHLDQHLCRFQQLQIFLCCFELGIDWFGVDVGNNCLSLDLVAFESAPIVSIDMSHQCHHSIDNSIVSIGFFIRISYIFGIKEFGKMELTFTRSFTHLFIYSFIHSFIHSFNTNNEIFPPLCTRHIINIITIIN
jgi:hypothetical protein